ncbi:MAG: NUDIX domain-containing protein [Rubrivivax sp.]
MQIAQRSLTKATDPGLFDNLIGGGVGLGQAPRETLEREAFEEAGLAPAEVAGAAAGRVIALARDIVEGYQQEWLYGFDVELPGGRVPVNQDGEVAGFRLMSVADAAALAAGDAMTVDAALVTLDFLLRHGCLDDETRRAKRPMRPRQRACAHCWPRSSSCRPSLARQRLGAFPIGRRGRTNARSRRGQLPTPAAYAPGKAHMTGARWRDSSRLRCTLSSPLAARSALR